MREADLVVPNDWEIPGDFTEASGYRAVGTLLELRQRPTAIFAANDAIPMARYMSPPLSSVHVSIAELGIQAVKTLVHAIDSKNEHARRHQRLETTLMIRTSCGTPEGERPPPA